MSRGGSVESFFAFIDRQNNAIAAREAEEAEAPKKPRGDDSGVGPDRFQIKKDAELREKKGQLRARPRSRNRPNTSRVVRGHMETPEPGE